MKRDTAAIIVAGGKGLRFGACLPAGRATVRKQYLLLKGKPIVWWSLRAFERCPSVRTMVLVAPAEDVPRLRSRIRAWKFRKFSEVVPGGATRADSVREGLSAVPETCRYVAVHDAVRPLIKPETIERVIQAARRSKAALAACPSKDTVKLSNGGGYIHSTPSRDKVWLAQTPQVFERRLLKRAHGLLSSPRRKPGPSRLDSGFRRNDVITDDAMLVEQLGVLVKLVESPADNMKITTPVDLMMARAVIASERSASQ